MKQKRKVLIVEDNELNRELLADILSDYYEILTAENGLVALNVLKEYKDKISIILSDVMMPVMDGYQLLDEIKKDPCFSLIPVIVTTQSDKDGEEVSALIHGATDFIPKPYRAEVILHRIKNLIELRENASIVNQFQYDQLTGLFSKEFFYQKVKEQLQEFSDQKYYIIATNIENFKFFNDTFGIKEGNVLLKKIADYFSMMIGDNGFCGRFSADRFVCFTNYVDYKMLDKMRPYNIPLMGNIIVRFGIFEVNDYTISVEQMVDRAMLAVDFVKGQYGKYYSVFDNSILDSIVKEKIINDEMEIALEENQFTVYLQPKYSIKEEAIVGAEALVRWIHPRLGFMPPNDFINVFEKNGFIFNLDRYVWDKVCSILGQWKKKGYPMIPISVNVSRADISRAYLIDIFNDLMKKYDIEPSYLHLEITESAYANNQNQIINMIKELRKNGFIIEMDDFGSGYSSLNMLSQMNVDVLKLDMKFIQNETEKPINNSILSDVINMAHRMNLTIVAEGVETRNQVNRLKEVGCDQIQGYFYSKPLPVNEFEEFIKNYRVNFSINKQISISNESYILIVDDDMDYIKKVKDAINEQYKILEAYGLQDTISYLENYGKECIKALIISMSLGNEAETILKMIRYNSSLWNIPIVSVISNSNKISNSNLFYEADDFVCRKHPIMDLRRRVLRLIDVEAFYKKRSSY